MSRKSRERREKNKAVRPDDYFSNGVFKMARFGKNTIVRNNRTPKQHSAQMEYMRTEYTSQYKKIALEVKSLKEKVAQCDPYSLLMYLRSLAAMGQMNIFSEIEYSSDANAIIRAQEYVQSILVSTDNNYVPSSPSEEAVLHAQIVADFDELYKDFRFFIISGRLISRNRGRLVILVLMKSWSPSICIGSVETAIKYLNWNR